MLEYHGCSAEALNDVERVRSLMEGAAKAAKMTIVTSVFHPFVPQGVTGVVVLEESHLSIHTWPERGYAAVDSYTCGSGNPMAAHEVLSDGLRAKRSEILEIERGQDPSGGDCMSIVRHKKMTQPLK